MLLSLLFKKKEKPTAGLTPIEFNAIVSKCGRLKHETVMRRIKYDIDSMQEHGLVKIKNGKYAFANPIYGSSGTSNWIEYVVLDYKCSYVQSILFKEQGGEYHLASPELIRSEFDCTSDNSSGFIFINQLSNVLHCVVNGSYDHESFVNHHSAVEKVSPDFVCNNLNATDGRPEVMKHSLYLMFNEYLNQYHQGHNPKDHTMWMFDKVKWRIKRTTLRDQSDNVEYEYEHVITDTSTGTTVYEFGHVSEKPHILDWLYTEISDYVDEKNRFPYIYPYDDQIPITSFDKSVVKEHVTMLLAIDDKFAEMYSTDRLINNVDSLFEFTKTLVDFPAQQLDHNNVEMVQYIKTLIEENR